ncbi:NAD(P)/FAD-dependent oxidoreductase [Aquabacterium sp.]|uniref:NAD(P)/FAD-dependent oxidoreductase n=1 Tax=Aquabacterium sp. TaxID=1872578 RepID=UPI002487A095|nr:NAD(P)/FAD-dependent oxidoreductase [Aquabacterium sp.]MDI1258428.1 NAD(P)/FAD-dependent oxidoreductase [Aquabacterium sp.]
MTPSSCDVLIIGGGPAGSTAAALLAQQGMDVVLLEKAQHPRFHIGESLLPANLPLLDQLGVRAEVEAMAMPKYGIEFVSPWHKDRTFLEFGEAWDKSMDMAYQVRRSDFDHILIRHAASKGAKVLENCQVKAVDFLPKDAGAVVQAQQADGQNASWQARIVIDASGRDTFLANKLGTKVKNKKHNSAALFGHFTGAQRLEGKQEGNISLFWFDHGWFWFIPLADGATSVGAVCWPTYLKTRKNSVEEFFMDTIALCPPLQARLKDAKLVSEVEATGNYSYSCDRARGPNYLLLGDAFAFIDPVFSSGVFLAMNSAFVAADVVHAQLREPRKLAAAHKRFDQVMLRGPREFSWFIYRVTNPTMRDLFMGPRNMFRVKEAVMSLFAGDIFRKTPIWPSIYVFKAIYYIGSLLTLKRTLAAARRRKINISDTAPIR